MKKSSLAVLLLSAACLTGPALAQSGGAPTASTPPASGDTSGAGQFITEQPMDQYRGSKLVGLGVYGPDHQRVGDINEVLLDKAGRAKVVVMGVGGFLGIAEKNVAVPFEAIEWMTEPVPAAGAGGPGIASAPGTAPAGAPNNTAATATATGTPGTMSTQGPATTGSTNPGATRSPAERAAANGYPDHAVVKMSKTDLQNAPAFKYVAETRARAASGAGAATSPATTAPRQ